MEIEKVTLPDIPPGAVEHIENFKNWYKNAQSGDWYIYYYGETLHENYQSKHLKDTVWSYACDGKIYIFQRRNIDDLRNFFFLAQKASRRYPHLNPRKTAEESRGRHG